METYTNSSGQECVIVTNPDGTTWSGLKSAYDEMTAQSTLPSNSSTPQAGA
jgi:hypothetical protein